MEFNTFEEWITFSMDNGKQMKNWSEDQLREFSDATAEAIEKNPDFAEKYHGYTERLEEKLKQKKNAISLDEEGKESLMQRRIKAIAEQKLKNASKVSDSSGKLDKLRGTKRNETPKGPVTIGSRLTPEEKEKNREILRAMGTKKRVISI